MGTRPMRTLTAALLATNLVLLLSMLRPHTEPAAVAIDAADMSLDMLGANFSALLAVASLVLLSALFVLTGRAPQSLANDVDSASAGAVELPIQHTAPNRLADPNSSLTDATRDGLMARLHHDLRTPLNAIIGFADLMQAETFGPLGNPRYRDYVSHMQSCGQDLLRAAETALAMTALLARPGNSSSEPVGLHAIATEGWQTAARNCRDRSPTIEIGIAADIVVRADKAALLQSLVCLFDAAIARSDSASRLCIHAAAGDGHVHAWIDLAGAHDLASAATTGCRPATSALAEIDHLATSAARMLLGLQNATLIESVGTPGRWTVQLVLEEAVDQRDFFDAPRPARAQSAAGERVGRYDQGFFGVVSVPGA